MRNEQSHGKVCCAKEFRIYHVLHFPTIVICQIQYIQANHLIVEISSFLSNRSCYNKVEYWICITCCLACAELCSWVEYWHDFITHCGSWEGTRANWYGNFWHDCRNSGWLDVTASCFWLAMDDTPSVCKSRGICFVAAEEMLCWLWLWETDIYALKPHDGSSRLQRPVEVVISSWPNCLVGGAEACDNAGVSSRVSHCKDGGNCSDGWSCFSSGYIWPPDCLIL